MRVALALSGGGIRAAAHLGIIKVLVDNGFKIEAISGSSAGALIGSLLCDGKSPEDILKIIKIIKIWDLMKGRRSGGIFGLQGVKEILYKNLNIKNIEESKVKLFIACTDLFSGKIHYFNKGPIAELSIASSSLVPIFAPVKYSRMLLADGGFVDNMPVVPLKNTGLPIIAINVNPIIKKDTSNLLKTTLRVLMLMMNSNVENSKQYCDFFIEPALCETLNIFDLKHVDKAYEIGYTEAVKLLPELNKKLNIKL